MKTFGSKLIDELWQSMGWTHTVLCTQQDHVASISIIYLKIYEQLFNKFTNVLYIKTPNKNIFISLSLSLSLSPGKGRKRLKWSEAELETKLSTMAKS